MRVSGFFITFTKEAMPIMMALSVVRDLEGRRRFMFGNSLTSFSSSWERWKLAETPPATMRVFVSSPSSSMALRVLSINTSTAASSKALAMSSLYSSSFLLSNFNL